MWAVESTAANSINSALVVDSINTVERLTGTAAVTGTCGSDHAAIKQDTPGQSVSFTLRNTVPLAAGQFVVWKETTDGGDVGWKINDIPDDSVTCTCAGHTWT